MEFDMWPVQLLALVCGLRVGFGGLDAVLSGDFLHALMTANVADEVVQTTDVLVPEEDAGELGVACVELDRKTERGLLVSSHARQVDLFVLDVVGFEE